MFSLATKEAVKVALSIVVSICLAIWFQWEKPYWAAIAAVVMAMNESFSHSVHKGHRRLLGTVLGIGYAFFLTAAFPQNPLLFLTFFSLFLVFCLFMSSDKNYGYAFSIGFTVCALITCMGEFDSEKTFYISILRMQETLLGVVVFSIIYRFIWPENIENSFIDIFEKTRNNIIKILSDGKSEKEDLNNKDDIIKMITILRLPLTGNYKLKQFRNDWQQRILEINDIQNNISFNKNHSKDTLINYKSLIESIKKFNINEPKKSLIDTKNSHIKTQPDIKCLLPYRTFAQHIKQDAHKVLEGLSMFMIYILLWIYLPIPGGAIFPMLAGIFSSIIPTMPRSIIDDAFLGIITTGSIILLEYIFIMPSLNDLLQLATFYFINVLAIWNIFPTPRSLIHRILGINLLVVLTSGALNLTPVYDINMPIVILTNVLLILMIAKIIKRLGFYHENYQN